MALINVAIIAIVAFSLTASAQQQDHMGGNRRHRRHGHRPHLQVGHHGQHMREQHKISIQIKRIVTWDEIFAIFNAYFASPAYNAVASGMNKRYEVPLTGVGLTMRAVVCPPPTKCPLNYTFQPPVIQSIGGICGVDFSPVPENGVLTRLFLVPQLLKKGSQEGALEGPRGLIVTSTGMLFDLAGGCDVCISIEPKVGDVLNIGEQHYHIEDVAEVVVAALHSHSATYFHAVNELLPRVFLGMDYILSNFNTSTETMHFSVRAHYSLMNSMNEMMNWGLTPSHKHVENHRASGNGSFIDPHMRGFVEATDNLIALARVDKSWKPLLESARSCVRQKLIEYEDRSPFEEKCQPVNLPPEYIVVIPRDGQRARTLVNGSALIDFMRRAFFVPTIVPDLNYGCKLQDNVRMFRNAIGFLSPHGAAFINIHFMKTTALTIQFIPVEKDQPFTGPIISYKMQAEKHGHKYFNIALKSSGHPRWDMYYTDNYFLDYTCNRGNGKPFNYMNIWKPTDYLERMCRQLKGAPRFAPPAPVLRASNAIKIAH